MYPRLRRCRMPSRNPRRIRPHLLRPRSPRLCLLRRPHLLAFNQLRRHLRRLHLLRTCRIRRRLPCRPDPSRSRVLRRSRRLCQRRSSARLPSPRTTTGLGLRWSNRSTQWTRSVSGRRPVQRSRSETSRLPAHSSTGWRPIMIPKLRICLRRHMIRKSSVSGGSSVSKATQAGPRTITGAHRKVGTPHRATVRSNDQAHMLRLTSLDLTENFLGCNVGLLVAGVRKMPAAEKRY